MLSHKVKLLCGRGDGTAWPLTVEIVQQPSRAVLMPSRTQQQDLISLESPMSVTMVSYRSSQLASSGHGTVPSTKQECFSCQGLGPLHACHRLHNINRCADLSWSMLAM